MGALIVEWLVGMIIGSECLCISWFHFVETVSEQSVLNEAQGGKELFLFRSEMSPHLISRAAHLEKSEKTRHRQIERHLPGFNWTSISLSLNTKWRKPHKREKEKFPKEVK